MTDSYKEGISFRDAALPASATDDWLDARVSSASSQEKRLQQESALAALLELAQAPSEQTSQAPDSVSALDRGRNRINHHRVWPRIALLPWPLAAVLVLQATLTLHLVWLNTAFQDEALYLWAGHLEWAHWVHGEAIPPFATYFSGAPVIYPPLAAIADSLGGLAAARILSLAFMLGATSLLWATTTRLFGRRGAFFACGLWSVLGPTLHLGAFATYDAMSLFLMALATWCAVRPGGRRDATGWMLACACAMALANATAYSSAIFDPVIIILAFLVASGERDQKPGIMRTLGLTNYAATILILMITAGGGYYEVGIYQTVISRAAGTDPVVAVLTSAWGWIGIISILSVISLLVSGIAKKERTHKWLIALLVGANLLVPLEQARIHTLTSLNKHVDAGAWFAAVAAGYAIDGLVSYLQPRKLQVLVAGLVASALVLPARLGLYQAKQLFEYPNASRFVVAFRSVVGHSVGHILVEDPSIGEYYTSAGTAWRHWSSTRSILLPSGRDAIKVAVTKEGQPTSYAPFIAHGYFSIIALNFMDTTTLDQSIASDLSRNPRYRVIETVPYGHGRYVIWERQGTGVPR